MYTLIFAVFAQCASRLVWVPDSGPQYSYDSTLLVGPVDETYNQSSYQCFVLSHDGNVTESDVGTITIIGTFLLKACDITSPSTGIISVSCQLLGSLEMIQVTLMYTSCTSSQPVTIVGDSPLVISNLIGGDYTIEVAVMDSNNISDGNDEIVEMVTVSSGLPRSPKRSDSLSTGVVVVITLTPTLLIPITITAVITFLIMHLFIKKKMSNMVQHTTVQQPDNTTNKSATGTSPVLYELVELPDDNIIESGGIDLQTNPAYSSSGGYNDDDDVVMDTNPAYDT
ncbi:uncharacterized protein [Dysidea avara]|uniref:uncharacterized protein n=1 Tax=Dysidea avara TaxID=196820 RepID=UPI00331A76C3